MYCRPRLKSHVQPLRRGPGSLQLGLNPGAGVVLDKLSDAEIAVVEGLDGSLDIRALYAVAASAGVAAGRLSSLISILDEHHLLVESATDRASLSRIDEPRRHLLRQDASAVAAAYEIPGDGFDRVAERYSRYVMISGEGDLPFALASLLRVGGIGRVSVGANAFNSLDLELRARPGGAASASPGALSHPTRLADSAHSRELPERPDGPDLPDLVVLAAMGALHPDAGEPWLRRGIPHLPLVVQGHRVQVGPLITAGDGPCLTCLDLHRRDRDAAWPAVLSQLAPHRPLLPAAPVSLESSLSAMTIGAAAMIVHTCLDGQPVSADLSLELSLPWPTIQNRRWLPHPMCTCAVRQATMTG